MTHIHTDKYEHFGGQFAAFDPKTNLRVGARVLHEYIGRTGSVEGGLKWYVGAANLPSDGGYAAKVMAEHARLRAVAQGRRVSPHDNSDLRAASAAEAKQPLQPSPAALPSVQNSGLKIASVS